MLALYDVFTCRDRENSSMEAVGTKTLDFQTACFTDFLAKTHPRYKLLGIGNHSSHELQGLQSIPKLESAGIRR